MHDKLNIDNAANAAEVAHAQHNLYGGDDSSYALAFQDPEFLLQRETRGIRLQLEMLKPDLIMNQDGIYHTIVAFGSARYVDEDAARQMLAQAATPEQKKATLALNNAKYYKLAYDFGALVAKRNLGLPKEDRLTVCTGGGPGIMEAANRGAFEQGDVTIGLNIALPFEQQPNPYITPRYCFHFHYFAMRKMHFMMRARALVAFPGGFGTLDELFEVLTLCQTQKSKKVPIVLVGKTFWNGLLNMPFLVEQGVISEEDLALFTLVDTPEEAWTCIQQFYNLAS